METAGSAGTPGPSHRVFGLHATVVRLALIHFVVDGYGNIYAPLLPLLIPRLGLTLAMAGTLAMCFQLASSVSQIGFGHLADRWRPRRLLMTGPLVAVLILSLIGTAGSAWMLGLVLVAGGLGGAAFHPPAAALAYRLGGNRPGWSMSVHITGGSLGFSLGPLLFAPFIEAVGLAWSPLLAVPGLLVVAALVNGLPPMTRPAAGVATGFGVLRPYLRPLGLLYACVVLRTLAALGFATFLPVMLTRRGLSVSEAAVVISVYLAASGVGGFLGGPAADRFGSRTVLIVSLLVSVPFLAAAPTLSGWALTLTLAVGGFFLQSTLPVNVTYGQMLAPVSAATVSSLMMGFAWGTGGMSAPLVGLLADRIGIERTLMLLSVAPIAAAACVWPLEPSTSPAAGRHVRRANRTDRG